LFVWASPSKATWTCILFSAIFLRALYAQFLPRASLRTANACAARHARQRTMLAAGGVCWSRSRGVCTLLRWRFWDIFCCCWLLLYAPVDDVPSTHQAVVGTLLTCPTCYTNISATTFTRRERRRGVSSYGITCGSAARTFRTRGYAAGHARPSRKRQQRWFMPPPAAAYVRWLVLTWFGWFGSSPVTSLYAFHYAIRLLYAQTEIWLGLLSP